MIFKEFLEPNIREKSLVAQRVIYDIVLPGGVKKVDPSEQLIASVKKSRLS